MEGKEQPVRIPFSLVFLALVLGEIAGFILVGQAIGVLPTLGLVLLGMVAGVLLLRRQGVATLMRVREELAADRPPARPLAEGALLAFAALLIILPGFLTDLSGLLLFVPFVRERIFQAVRSRVAIRTVNTSSSPADTGPVVDLDHREYGRSRERTAPNPNSPWRLRGGPEA
jgi:UPF0716 protein FxsA